MPFALNHPGAARRQARLLGGGDELRPRRDAGQPLHDVQFPDSRRQREVAPGIQGLAKLGVDPAPPVCGQSRVQRHKHVAEPIEVQVP